MGKTKRPGLCQAAVKQQAQRTLYANRYCLRPSLPPSFSGAQSANQHVQDGLSVARCGKVSSLKEPSLGHGAQVCTAQPRTVLGPYRPSNPPGPDRRDEGPGPYPFKISRAAATKHHQYSSRTVSDSRLFAERRGELPT